MVVLDQQGQPLTVSPSELNEWNVIMWLDHRAGDQADRINRTQHKVLRNVGDKISLEMQTPKMLWLKENMKETWNKAGHFMGLPDFLTWRATDSNSRSLCSSVCKWTYQANNTGEFKWDEDYFRTIGLGDLADTKFAQIGVSVQAPGQPCGQGLSPAAARELGLQAGTAVGASMIDAHAGGLGTLGCSVAADHADSELNKIPLTSRLAVICGTSSCHMAVCEQAVFVPGVWGPYYSALVPGLWLTEGGQSATGKLIDHVVKHHAAYPWIQEEAKRSESHEYEVLNKILKNTAEKSEVSSVAQLTKHLHMWPDFHGNRSPLQDASLKGMISGLSLSSGVEELACLYLATIQAIAYGSRHILDTMNQSGHNIKLLIACGGLAKNSLFIETHADISGMPVILPDESESVLLGAAMLGACASKHFESIQDAMGEMCGTGQVVRPDPKNFRYHEKKYKVFLRMVEHQRIYRRIMDEP